MSKKLTVLCAWPTRMMSSYNVRGPSSATSRKGIRSIWRSLPRAMWVRKIHTGPEIEAIRAKEAQGPRM